MIQFRPKIQLRTLLVCITLIAFITAGVLSIYSPWKNEKIALQEHDSRLEWIGVQYCGPRFLQPYMQQFPWYNRVWCISLNDDNSSDDTKEIVELFESLDYLEEVEIPDTPEGQKIAHILGQLELKNVRGLPVVVSMK